MFGVLTLLQIASDGCTLESLMCNKEGRVRHAA